MPRNLSRLSAAANRNAATMDYAYVAKQLEQLGHRPPIRFNERMSAKQIDKETRKLINWSKAHEIEINLPDGWE